ncbi:MAG TPA: hypothetical protein VNO21_19635 [Polyangiaceae bacterium]|nr:hypothetical protein [Polyangiaceae bacterium]
MRCAPTAVFLLFGLALFTAACGGATELPLAAKTPGTATPVDPPRASALPEGHPDVPLVPLAEPASNDGHVGRAARRLSVDQLRASLLAATGHTWVASRRVSDPDSPSGVTQIPDADMLEALAATLGRPDYVTSTNESIDPAVTFAKLANDAARSACRTSVNADLAAGNQEKHILRYVTARDTLASNPTAIHRNFSYLALRFWGRQIQPESTELDALARLFGKVSAPPGTTSEAWRAVCIAMATDPQFLTY